MGNLALCFLVYKAWQDHFRSWKVQKSRWQIALLLLSGLLVSVAALVLLALTFATLEAWRSALDPDTPAPLFEIFWIVGIFAVSIPAAIAGVIQTFVRKDFDELSL